MSQRHRAVTACVGAVGVALAIGVLPVRLAATTDLAMAVDKSTGLTAASAGRDGRIAFIQSSGCHDFYNDPCLGDSGLYLADADGTHVQRLTRLRSNDLGPAVWAPNGRQLAFASSEEYFSVIDTDGGAARQLGEGSQPTWSPDGRRIAFTSRHPTARRGEYITVMNADGSHSRRLTPGFFGPAWSPNGRWIAFGTMITDLLCVIDADTASRNQRCTASDGFGHAWSPDGRLIAFRRSTDDISYVHVRDVTGRHVKRLAAGWAAAWSPDGRRIAFTRLTGQPSPRGMSVFVMRRDGTHVQRLTHLPENNFGPVWSPDGGRILFSHETEDRQRLYVMDSDGDNVQPLTSARRYEYDQHPAWFGAAPTRTTLNVRPESPAKGARLMLTGRVTKTRIPLAGARVLIHFKKTGADFTTVTTLTTGPAGRYRARVPARTSGTWKAVHPGTPATLTSSAKDKITLRR